MTLILLAIGDSAASNPRTLPKPPSLPSLQKKTRLPANNLHIQNGLASNP